MPGHPGQAEVEHQQIVQAAGGRLQPLEPVVHQVGVVAVLLQPAPHVGADGAVVLDDEDLHTVSPRTGR